MTSPSPHVVRVPTDAVALRLDRCAAVCRHGVDDAMLREALRVLDDVDPDLPVRTWTTVRRPGAGSGPSLRFSVDEAAPEIPEMDAGGLRLVVEHCLATPPSTAERLDRILVARAFSGDPLGRRSGASILGLTGGTPWSDPAVAGHGRGWGAGSPDEDASDMPFVHAVRANGGMITFEQHVVLGSAKALRMDPMEIARTLLETGAAA